MAKSDDINAENYREPVPTNYALDYKGYTCQLKVHNKVRLYHEEYGEKTSPYSTNLREGVTIPTYDSGKKKDNAKKKDNEVFKD